MQPVLKAALRGAIDLILPPQAFDGGARPLAEGLSGAAWSRIQFIEDPVCDRCGAFPPLSPERSGGA